MKITSFIATILFIVAFTASAQAGLSVDKDTVYTCVPQVPGWGCMMK